LLVQPADLDYSAEIWPLSARPYGIAIGASSNWMNNFIVGQVTPDMIASLRWGTFLLFGALILLGAAVSNSIFCLLQDNFSY